MGIKFANNASTNITHALTADATSISVTPGTGDLFPSIVEGKDYFYATLAGNNGLEIVKVTRRVLDTMTVERAQDGTSALIFNQGDLFELRIVAADFNDTFSEVDDKLEASIEDTIEIVNSALARTAPTSHASSSTEYGAGSSEQYGHLKSHDEPDSTFTAAAGHAFSPAGAAAMQDVLEGQIGDLASVVSGNAATQAAKDAEQDAAINSKVATVNGLTPDSNGNVDVGGMPLGTLFPYTGKDVPAGTLRADGTTYTNMQASFPEFYEWVVNSGLTVALGDYALVEGSCGYYGLDTGTGIVRMPTLAAGVFGTVTAGQYGQAVQAGLPNITGELINFATSYASTGDINNGGALRWKGTNNKTNIDTGDKRGIKTLNFDASNSNSIYGNSDTVTPSHVKYPWVIVVYNAAVPPSVAQAGEFVELLDSKFDKTGGNIVGAVKLHEVAGFYVGDLENANEVVALGAVEEVVGKSAILALRTARATNDPGAFLLGARHPEKGDKYLVGTPDGGLYWNSKPVAVLSMPAARVANWSLGANGTRYTAPATGWVYFNKDGAAGTQISLQNTSKAISSRSCASLTTALSVFVPCTQGDIITVLYTASGKLNALQFIYAEGA